MDLDKILGECTTIPPSQKQEYDTFIKEYFKDYDSYRAVLRMNYDGEEALEKAKQLWENPYVQQAIAEIQDNRSALFKQNEERDPNKLPDDFVPNDEELDKQRIVSALFREGFYKGPGSTQSARVSALTKLASIYKLDMDKPPEADGRSVMIVPGEMSLEDWEAQAKKQQTQLKEEVKQ